MQNVIVRVSIVIGKIIEVKSYCRIGGNLVTALDMFDCFANRWSVVI